jgi:hypothetical protein
MSLIKKKGLMSLSEVNTAIIKATNHDICPPKEKHVQSSFYFLKTLFRFIKNNKKKNKRKNF